jgi:AP-3 complex subunit delta-1
MTSRQSTVSAVVFQKTLQDLIKGVRSNKLNTNEFISLCIVEIKQELSSTDPFAKAEAVGEVFL